MIIYYGIKIKDKDNNWKWDCWDDGQPCLFSEPKKKSSRNS